MHRRCTDVTPAPGSGFFDGVSSNTTSYNTHPTIASRKSNNQATSRQHSSLTQPTPGRTPTLLAAPVATLQQQQRLTSVAATGIDCYRVTHMMALVTHEKLYCLFRYLKIVPPVLIFLYITIIFLFPTHTCSLVKSKKFIIIQTLTEESVRMYMHRVHLHPERAPSLGCHHCDGAEPVLALGRIAPLFYIRKKKRRKNRAEKLQQHLAPQSI